VQHLDDSVSLAAEPHTVAARLIASLDDFAHLKEADPSLLFVFSERGDSVPRRSRRGGRPASPGGKGRSG
jgi:hypothetical protein